MQQIKSDTKDIPDTTPQIPGNQENTKPVSFPKTTYHRNFVEDRSQDIDKLAEALAKAQGEMVNGTKNKQGYGYKYMDLSTLIDIAKPALSKNDLAIIQSHELLKGTLPSVVTKTTLLHASGQWYSTYLELPIKVMPQLSQAQMVGVACTYGRRYTLQAMCLVAAEEDTDGTIT